MNLAYSREDVSQSQDSSHNTVIRSDYRGLSNPQLELFSSVEIRAQGNTSCQCGETERKLAKGKGPHAAKWICVGCQKHLKWVGKAELASLQEGGAA